MNARHYKFGVALIALLFLVGMSGCLLDTIKYTGGGTIPSANKSCADDEKVNFGFVLNNCGDEVKGNLTYHDQYYEINLDKCDDFDQDKFGTQAQNLGVKLQGEFTGFAIGDYVLFTYESKNSFCRGFGDGKAFVVDGGEGANAEDDDLFCIILYSGPFKNYTNCGRWWSGEVVQGNIQEHDCKPADCE